MSISYARALLTKPALTKPILWGLAFLTICLVWEGSVIFWRLPEYIFPKPSVIAAVFWREKEFFAYHSMITGAEIVLAVIFGLTSGFLAGVGLWKFSALRALFWPVVLMSQAIPVFAIAPLLVIWFGFGMASKVVMATLIVFFPVTVAVKDGLERIAPAWLAQATLMGAKERQKFLLILLPGALAGIVTGAKVAAAAAPIGAIVGEWVGASGGLGYVMLQANAQVKIAHMFAALGCLFAFTFLLYGLVSWTGRKILFWQEDNA